MRAVMFDVVPLTGEALPGKRLFQKLDDVAAFPTIAQPPQNQLDGFGMAKNIGGLPREMRGAKLVYRDVVYIL